VEKIRRAAVGVGSLVVAAGLGWGCRGKDSDNGTTKTDLIATSSKAKATLASLRERAGALLPSSAADGFRVAIGGLKPQFGAGSEKLATRLLLPERSPAPLHIEHATSDTSIDVRLRDVRDVPAEVADGYVVYRNALRGATLLHRPSPDGVEDFVSFETRPATPEIAYDVGMGLGAQGFRLTNDTLEVLDAKGAPRLRVSPPYLVGADGIRTDAKLFDNVDELCWRGPTNAFTEWTARFGDERLLARARAIRGRSPN